MARLYTNENVSLRIVEVLRKLGHDVLTSRDAGNANRGIPDEGVLAFALTEGRVLLTNNRRHFVGLHRGAHRHAGIVVYTVHPDAEGVARRIDAALGDPRAQDRFLARVDGIAFTFDR